MIKNTYFLIFVLVLAGLNLGTVRKTEDPIRDTQTDPIAYKQKMEEEKDGKKGPLTYSVKYNPRDTFFIDPPYTAKPKAAETSQAAEQKPEGLSSWWEEEPATPASSATLADAPPSPGVETKGTEASPEPASGESVPAAEAGQTSKDDYWW